MQQIKIKGYDYVKEGNECVQVLWLNVFLKKESNNEKLRRAGDALQKYSSVFDYAKYIPKVGEYIALLKPLIEGLGKQISDVSDDMDSIENQKNLVITALKELKQKKLNLDSIMR